MTKVCSVSWRPTIAIVVYILELSNDASWAWSSIFLAPTGAKRLAVGPLDAAVLVPVEASGVAAEVAGVGVIRHGGC